MGQRRQPTALYCHDFNDKGWSMQNMPSHLMASECGLIDLLCNMLCNKHSQSCSQRLTPPNANQIIYWCAGKSFQAFCNEACGNAQASRAAISLWAMSRGRMEACPSLPARAPVKELQGHLQPPMQAVNLWK